MAYMTNPEHSVMNTNGVSAHCADDTEDEESNMGDRTYLLPLQASSSSSSSSVPSSPTSHSHSLPSRSIASHFIPRNRSQAFIGAVLFCLVFCFLLVQVRPTTTMGVFPQFQQNIFQTAAYFSTNFLASSRTKGAEEEEEMGMEEGGGRTGAELVKWLVEMYRVDFYAQWAPDETLTPWEVAEDWVTEREVLPSYAPELGAVLHSLSTFPIISLDNSFEGTQLKLILTLAGGQQVVFKPKWYERDVVLDGAPKGGRDRHNGEIAAFHLSRILELRKTPLVVGRKVSVKKDIIPSVPPHLQDTFYEEDGQMCFYGKCEECHKENAICTSNGVFEGTIILWLPTYVHLKEWRNPWRTTFKEKLEAKWEKDDPYCNIVRQIEPFATNRRLFLDFMDVTVFDYLIANSDRHHFEVMDGVDDGMLVMLDNGKSFGNPYQDERSILAPLIQCCSIRKSTWQRLKLLQHNVLSSVLREVLRKEPLYPVLTEQHLQALDRRLLKVLQEIHLCVQLKGLHSVIVADEGS